MEMKTMTIGEVLEDAVRTLLGLRLPVEMADEAQQLKRVSGNLRNVLNFIQAQEQKTAAADAGDEKTDE